MSLLPILKGLGSYVLPAGLYHRHLSGTADARYCYSVFLRHLVLLEAYGGNSDPRNVAELGPGFSIGIGLAALIAGADRYDGFDTKSFDIVDPTRRVFEDLVKLFEARAPIPDETELPEIKPRLDDYRFPAHIIRKDRLARALEPERIARFRAALRGEGQGETMIRYVAPWNDAAKVEPGSVDWIFSQAVMEHVDDLADTYLACFRWLRPEGVMTHQIDFRCHNTAREWNGHWARSDLTWRLIRGARPFLLNREPYSRHRRLMQDYGFEILGEQLANRGDGIDRAALAARFRDMSDRDLTTSGAFVAARKPTR
jgi:SAM-dependent methyltransferase